MSAQSVDTSGASTSERLEKVISDLEKRLEVIETPVLKRRDNAKNIQLGLSFGFNGYVNGPRSYFVKEDSTLGTYGNTKGVTGMLSALIGYKVHNKHTIYLNIPLSDLTNGPNQTIGIFNKKIAGGLGYGYNIDRVSVIAVINMYPYEDLATKVVRNKKYNQEPYTALNREGLPTETLVSPSITIGMCYNFLQPKELLFVPE
ncbi:MAG: hypothetical protein ACPGYY_05970 [Bacteroidia bacterium]